MHTISVAQRRDGQYRFECSCGTNGNWYGTADVARSTGYTHKEAHEGKPNRPAPDRDDPHIGF